MPATVMVSWTQVLGPTVRRFLRLLGEHHPDTDFENTALHGTFLIDGEGLVRWQDISYEPFADTQFLLDEVRRLLSLKSPPGAPGAAAR
jgi:hypothetical protein